MFLDVLDALCCRDLCTNCASLCPSESLSRLEASWLLLAVGIELINHGLKKTSALLLVNDSVLKGGGEIEYIYVDYRSQIGKSLPRVRLRRCKMERPTPHAVQAISICETAPPWEVETPVWGGRLPREGSRRLYEGDGSTVSGRDALLVCVDWCHWIALPLERCKIGNENLIKCTSGGWWNREDQI